MTKRVVLPEVLSGADGRGEEAQHTSRVARWISSRTRFVIGIVFCALAILGDLLSTTGNGDAFRMVGILVLGEWMWATQTPEFLTGDRWRNPRFYALLSAGFVLMATSLSGTTFF